MFSLTKGDPAITNGLAVGSATGLLFFLSTWFLIYCIVRSKKDKGGNPLLAVLAIKLFIFKFPLFGLLLWLAFKFLQINPFALIFGIGITQMAILLAALVKIYGKKE